MVRVAVAICWCDTLFVHRTLDECRYSVERTLHHNTSVLAWAAYLWHVNVMAFICCVASNLCPFIMLQNDSFNLHTTHRSSQAFNPKHNRKSSYHKRTRCTLSTIGCEMKLCRRHLRLPCDLLIYYICSSSVPAFTSIRLNVSRSHSVFNIRCLSHVPIHRSNSPKHLKTEDRTGDGIEIDAGSGSFQMTVTDAVIVYTNTNPTAIDTRIRIVFCFDVMQRCCGVMFTCVRSRQSILIVFSGVLPCIG